MRRDGGYRVWMNASSSVGANASGTPRWGNFKEDMNKMRDDMRGKMASLTDAQIISISAKLGVTADVLKAELATGTPLRAIIGNKITKEDMMAIFPNMGMMASGSAPTSVNMIMHPPMPPQGFFNSIREKLFGGGEDMNGHADVDVNASGSMQGEPIHDNPIRNFFKRIFNF